MNVDYARVLWNLYPDAHWTMSGGEYESLLWLSDMPKPTQEELDAAWPEVEAAVELARIQRQRADRYTVEADPLFFKWQRGEGTEADWLAAVEAIRNDLPYPS